MEESNYYPFGLKHQGYNDGSLLNDFGTNYKYSFQGQERQEETGWSSFKWRNYDTSIGRFFNVDPLSEKYAYQSHYNFSENCVINSRELEGLEKVLAIFYTGGFQGGAKTIPSSSQAGTAGKLFDYAASNAQGKGYEFKGAIIASGATNGPSVSKGTDFIENNYEKGDIVITYGYSYGGDNAMELGSELNDKNIPVQLSMIVDSSDGIFKNSTVKTDVSENTKMAVNTYQTTPDPTTSARGEPLKPDNKNKTTVINTNLTSKTITHQNIDENALDINKVAIAVSLPKKIINMKQYFYYRLCVLLIIVIVWFLIYLAKISDYSINYGYEFKALILSSIFSIFLIIMFFYKKTFYKKNLFYNTLFLITSSPVSLLCFIRIYVEFFGPFFKF